MAEPLSLVFPGGPQPFLGEGGTGWGGPRSQGLRSCSPPPTRPLPRSDLTLPPPRFVGRINVYNDQNDPVVR